IRGTRRSSVMARTAGAAEYKAAPKTLAPGENGLHRYLTLTAEQQVRVTESLVQLCTQPPRQSVPCPTIGGCRE
ncbi:MAG: hypothetical protein ACKPJJ_25825, partial [Planctomycetaceae bacterium]